MVYFLIMIHTKLGENRSYTQLACQLSCAGVITAPTTTPAALKPETLNPPPGKPTKQETLEPQHGSCNTRTNQMHQHACRKCQHSTPACTSTVRTHVAVYPALITNYPTRISVAVVGGGLLQRTHTQR
jgi:hypothetical protein